ncbi:hypothetical protein YQE_09939, partial [Dendroctonus ponderosae]
MIRDRFINIVDAEKMGLPRVLDTIEISCKTRHNVKLLCNLIYDTVFSLRPPGSKELLLEQKVPATYLALEDIVTSVAVERRVNGLDPVLTSDQYKSIMTLEMQQRYNKSFRDSAELHQATLFLHENGVLLHYDDATLKDLYFLDPQWLCDMLAHVVTIREINPFARTGVMKLDDLKHVFKASNIGPIDTRGYVVNLLNKFEVALTWDSRTLLIPSLLPSEEDMIIAQMYPGQAVQPLVKVKVPLRSRGWAVRSKKLTVSPKSVLYNTDGSKGFQLTMAANLSSKIGNGTSAMGYVSYDWREAEVGFIPKPGKKDYTEPKSFRPISLTSFLMKMLEKIIDRYLTEEVLIRKAYRKGRLTLTAFHAQVQKAEQGLQDKEVTLALVFDVERAVNKATSAMLSNQKELSTQ